MNVPGYCFRMAELIRLLGKIEKAPPVPTYTGMRRSAARVHSTLQTTSREMSTVNLCGTADYARGHGLQLWLYSPDDVVRVAAKSHLPTHRSPCFVVFFHGLFAIFFGEIDAKYTPSSRPCVGRLSDSTGAEVEAKKPEEFFIFFKLFCSFIFCPP